MVFVSTLVLGRRPRRHEITRSTYPNFPFGLSILMWYNLLEYEYPSGPRPEVGPARWPAIGPPFQIHPASPRQFGKDPVARPPVIQSLCAGSTPPRFRKRNMGETQMQNTNSPDRRSSVLLTTWLTELLAYALAAWQFASGINLMSGYQASEGIQQEIVGLLLIFLGLADRSFRNYLREQSPS